MVAVRKIQYDEFGAPGKKEADDDGGGVGVPGDLSSPESLPDHERPPLRHIDKYVRAECPCLTKRATVALFSCLGFIIMFGMRASMGIVKLGFKKSKEEATKGTQSAEDSAIFWGYFVTQIPGGLIAAAYPANRLFGIAIGTSSLLNLFIPTIYHIPEVLIIFKVMQGLVEGVTYPACHGIMRHWAPPLERSRLATLAFSGCYAGVMFAMPICGILVSHLGTLSPFYFYGMLGILWYISWLWLVFEKPSLDPAISTKEMLYIENSLGGSNLNYVKPTIANTPWKAFFTSMPCYAIFVANFCRSWNFYLLVLFQASYFNIYPIQLEYNAILGALPHLLMTIIVPSGGILADRLRKKGILTTTQVRKLFNCGGFGMEATFFIIMVYCDTMPKGMAALTIGVAFSGFAISGFNVNHLDIAPRYASILMGMSNGIGTIAGCICPYVVHWIIGENPTIVEWREVFIISAFIHYAGVIFYAIFASGELQPWADPQAEEEKQWNPMNETVPMNKPANNGLLQRQLSTKLSYGSVDGPSVPSATAPATPPPSYRQVSFDKPPRPPAPAAVMGSSVPPNQQQQQQQPYPVVPSSNPFLASGGGPGGAEGASSRNPFRQEAVQPEAQDTYLHGSIDDRTY